MTTTRPGLYPLHDLLELNIVLPEDSLYLQGGYPTGLPVPSGDHNGKLNRSGLWHQYLDANGIRNADWLEVAQTMTLSATRLAYNVGGNVLTTGATVLSRGVQLVFGTRIETDAAFLNQVGTITGDPLIFPGATVPGRIWIYASETGTSRIESVGPAVADLPSAGEVTLVGLQIDGAGVVTNGNLTPSTPLPADLLRVEIPLRALYLLLEATNTALEIYAGGVTGGDPAAIIDGDIGPALAVSNSSPTDDAVSVTASGGATGLFVTGTARGVYVDVSGSSSGVQVDNSGTGDGITIASAEIGIAVASTNNSAITATGGTSSQVIYAEADQGIAVRGVALTTGVGISGLGGSSSSSIAVQGLAGSVDANAIEGFTNSSANSGAVGVRGIGRGAGIGVHAQSTGTGYALLVTGDTTSPTRASARFVPQDADAGTPLQGDWQFNSARTASGKFRGYTTQWESMHSSAKGWVRQWGLQSAGGPIAGGSGNLSLCQVTPEVVGEVLVSATGSLEFSLDTGACTVVLTDVTSGVTVATQIERAIDTDAVAPNVRSFAIRGIRTLPSTVVRTFAVVITATTGTITYANVVCMVEGVQ